VIVVSREGESGTRAAFEEAVMDGRPVTLNAIVQPDSGAMIDAVARTPGAIGYVSRGRLAAAVRPIAVEGIDPAPHDERYPLRRALYVVSKNEPEGAARDFVRWLLDPDGQQAIAERGFGRVK
jgi:phosphate transport system substrate-binding protein